MDPSIYFKKPRAAGFIKRVPFRLLLLAAGICILIAGTFVYSSWRDEERRMVQEMKAQSDMLIWALEGGTRSMMHESKGSYQQRLLEEVAKQPQIRFLAIVDGNGQILAHSSPEQVGQWLTEDERKLLPSGADNSRFVTTTTGEEVFERIKPFSSCLRHDGGQRKMGHTSPFAGALCPRGGASGQDVLYTVVGMDVSSFKTMLKKHVTWTALVAFSLAAASAAGLFLLFFIQGYQTSRRLLHEARSLTLELFENLPIGLFLVSPAGEVTLYNKPGAIMLGLGTGTGHTSLARRSPAFDWKSFISAMDAGQTVLDQEITLEGAGGKLLPVNISACPVRGVDGSASGYLFILRDLGEIKKLQQQVRLSERLTALGNMAAGIAHEIRNPLSTIKGYATYLAEKLSPDTPEGDVARTTIEEVERLDRVVSGLLTVARSGKLSLTGVSLSQVVEKALRLTENEAATKGVIVTYDASGLKGESLSLRLDEDKFVQALLNLLLNAIQASHAGGHVRVMASVVSNTAQSLDEGTLFFPAGSHPDTGVDQERFVLLQVSDDGCGMSAETRAHLFTPYFTTKASGTGLGLTITHQIIEQHAGKIAVSSSLGQGAAFTIILPIQTAEGEVEREA